MSDDNWKHRSKGMKCESCMFFVEKITNAVQRGDRFIGRCRRHAPTMGGFPVVFSNDWCGDHKLDETAVQGEATDAPHTSTERFA